MTGRQIAALAPVLLLGGLQVYALIRSSVSEHRGRALYLKEAGGTKADWEKLRPSEKRAWEQRVRDDRQIARALGPWIRQRNKARSVS